MALAIKDGNSATKYLPNSGIDAGYSASSNGLITSSNTSATDVYQMVGAAGVVARIRRIEIIGTVVIAAPTTVAAASTLVRLLRRTAAGTTGTWTALTEAGGTLGRFRATDAAASVVVNGAGTTAFTVGAGTQMIRQGIVCHPALMAVTNIMSSAPGTPLVWDFGINGEPPLYLEGATDYLVLNLNGVTPVGTLAINIFWDEATT